MKDMSRKPNQPAQKKKLFGYLSPALVVACWLEAHLDDGGRELREMIWGGDWVCGVLGFPFFGG